MAAFPDKILIAFNSEVCSFVWAGMGEGVHAWVDGWWVDGGGGANVPVMVRACTS